MIELTDQNFIDEVEKASLPVLVDFWAPWCIAPETEVLIGDRESISASKLSVGQKIIAFNGKKTKSEVLYSDSTKGAGHCCLITTQTGRKIKVTNDHQFWTQDGWKVAQSLKKGEKLAVFSSVQFLKQREQSKNRKLIAKEKDIRKLSLPRMRVENYVEELKNKSLLPLRLDNPRLTILARLVGFCLADGNLYHSERNNYREINFAVGDKNDIQLLKYDFSQLGFFLHHKERTSLNEINGRKFKMHTFKVKCLSSALWLLLKALKVPGGNKTNQAYGVPAWILRSPQFIQREFLAGFLGGDGPRVAITERKRKSKGSYNKLNINDLEFYKREDLIDSGLIFAQKLAGLMSKFGVEIVRIFVRKAPYKRKDGSQTKIIHIKFKQNLETGHALARKIGYAYCTQKSQIASEVGEFLARIIKRRKTWNSLYQESFRLEKKQKINPNQIAHKLGISAGASYGWLRYDRKPKVNKHFEKFPSWLKEAKRKLRNGLFWDVIEENQSTYLPLVQRISADKPHNFIANGFLVHNCGPCQMAGPVIEELAQEYKDKIKVGKLNIDENQTTAQKYKVMSIPTVVFFKAGQEVKRQVGFPGKEGYKQLIDEVLND